MCLFLINGVSFAIEPSGKREVNDTLSPASRLDPVVSIEEKDGEFSINEDPAALDFLEKTDTFRNDMGFLYMSLLIGQALTRFDGRISVDALEQLIKRHLSHVDLGRFRFEGMYEDQGSICLPYRRQDRDLLLPLVLRYYLPNSGFAGAAGEVIIPVGEEEVRMRVEDPRQEMVRQRGPEPEEVDVEKHIRALLNGAKGKALIVPVCQANMIRSPQMELALRDLVQKRGMEEKLAVISAGTGPKGSFGRRPADYFFSTASEMGISSRVVRDMREHFANKPVTAELLRAADLIIVAERKQKTWIYERFAGSVVLARKVVTYEELRKRIGDEAKDLEDAIDMQGIYRVMSGNFTFISEKTREHAGMREAEKMFRADFGEAAPDVKAFLTGKRSGALGSYAAQFYSVFDAGSHQRVTRFHAASIGGSREIFYSKTVEGASPDLLPLLTKKLRYEAKVMRVAHRAGVAPETVFVKHGDIPIIITGEAEGEPLSIWARDRLGEEVIEAVGNALGRLHAAGVCHNDLVPPQDRLGGMWLKADHIYLESAPEGVKASFIDFGLAELFGPDERKAVSSAGGELLDFRLEYNEVLLGAKELVGERMEWPDLERAFEKGYEKGLGDRTGEGRSAHLKLPSPRGCLPDIDDKVAEIIEIYCKPFEQDEDAIVPEASVEWGSINAYMRRKGLEPFEPGVRPVLHVVGLANDLKGFPLESDTDDFSGVVPAVSYISDKDGRLHVFVTNGFYDDYLYISHMREGIHKKRHRVLRFSEMFDHERFEHSEECRFLPRDERHHAAARRARFFIPRGQRISDFHKWAIDSLALTPEGREHIMKLLDEYRLAPEDEVQDDYERVFYDYAKSVLPRGDFPKAVQREAHHVLRVYANGDRRRFRELCRREGVDPDLLDKDIQDEERRHVKNALEGFSPDIRITDTTETDVEIDHTKGIVRKSLKNKYVRLIWGDILPDEKGKMVMSTLLQEYSGSGGLDTSRQDISYSLKFLGEKAGIEGQDDEAIAKGREVFEDYLQQLQSFASYLRAQNRLGGLIADFTIAGGDIYQEKVMPLTVYLQHLVAGTGPFAELADRSFANRVSIGWDVLEKYIECLTELGKRGALVSNMKLTNFGVRENGEVVLLDLGPSTILWMDDSDFDREFAEDMIAFRSAVDTSRLKDLNADFVAEETGVKMDFSGIEDAVQVQEELARIWIRLISGRTVADGEEVASDVVNDGRELAEQVMRAVPEEGEEAHREYRSITFIPTDIAREEILQIIMRRIAETGRRDVPDGAPAIALLKIKGRWEQYEISAVEHFAINLACKELWDKGYGLPEGHPLKEDIRHYMGEDARRLPIHIHSPPAEMFYDTLYRIVSEKALPFPPREQFRLITHPGTYRDPVGHARSVNLFIPADALDLIMEMKTKGFAVYEQWLFHELGHLMDRIYKRHGEELSEQDITSDNPVFLVVAEYNDRHSVEDGVPAVPEKGARMIDIIDRLADDDPYVVAGAARDLLRILDRKEYEPGEKAFMLRAVPILAGSLHRVGPPARGFMLKALLELSREDIFMRQTEDSILDMISSETLAPSEILTLNRFFEPEAKVSVSFRKEATLRFLDRLGFETAPGKQALGIRLLCRAPHLADPEYEAEFDRVLSAVDSMMRTGEYVYHDIVGTGILVRRRSNPLSSRARKEALSGIVRLFRINAEAVLKDISEAPWLYSRTEHFYAQYRTIHQLIFSLFYERDESYAPDPGVRAAAVRAMAELADAKIDFMLRLSGINNLPERDLEEIMSEVERTRRDIVRRAGMIALGDGSVEKNIHVREECAKMIADNIKPGMMVHPYPMWLVETLFDTTRGEDVPDYEQGRARMNAHLVKAIISSGDRRALEVITMIARNYDGPLGDLIGFHLSNHATRVTGRDRSMPDGSPYTMFELLRHRGPSTAEDLRVLTGGRMPDGHLSADTVKRDLGTLAYLGLAEVKGKGSVYRALDTDPLIEEDVESILRGLGARPTGAEKEQARGALAALAAGKPRKEFFDEPDAPGEAGIAVLEDRLSDEDPYVVAGAAVELAGAPENGRYGESDTELLIRAGSAMGNMLNKAEPDEREHLLAGLLSLSKKILLPEDAEEQIVERIRAGDVTAAELIVCGKFLKTDISVSQDFRSKAIRGLFDRLMVENDPGRQRLAIKLACEASCLSDPGSEDLCSDTIDAVEMIAASGYYRPFECRKDVKDGSRELSVLARSEAIRHLPGLFDLNTVYALRELKKAPNGFFLAAANIRYDVQLYGPVSFMLRQIIEKGSERYSPEPIVRRAAAMAIAGVALSRKRFHERSRMIVENGTGRESDFKMPGERHMLQVASRAALGGDPEEKDTGVRRELLRFIAENITPGEVSADLLFETLLDPPEGSGQTGVGAEIIREMEIFIIRALISCGDNRAREVLESVAKESGPLGRLVKKELEEQRDPDGWVSLPGGSPYAEINIQGVPFEELKKIILGVREDCGDWGVCKLHSEELLRRLTKAGIKGKVMEKVYGGDPHWWVETDEYVLDAYPEGMGEEYIAAARALGDERFTVARKGSDTARRLYRGLIDMPLTETAIADAENAAGFFERKREFASRRLRERRFHLAESDGVTPADIDRDREVLRWEKVVAAAEEKLNRAIERERRDLYGRDEEMPVAEPPDISDEDREEAYSTAVKLRDAVKILAFEAALRRENVVIGVDTSWIPELQRELSSMRRILNSIEDLSGEKGLENVKIFVQDRTDVLAGEVFGALGPGTPLTNVIMLGEDKVLDSVFKGLKGDGKKDGAFFAKVKKPDGGFAEGVDIDIVNMLREALVRASDPGKPREFYPEIPDAEEVGINDLDKLYEMRLEALIRA